MVMQVATSTPAAGVAGRSGIWCCEFELSGTGGVRSVVEPTTENSVRVLVRLHGEPVGYVSLQRAQADDPSMLVPVIWQRLREPVLAHLRQEGIVPSGVEGGTYRPPAATASCPNATAPSGTVSVVVCTRNRSTMLEACLDRLSAVTYPQVEFIVVDNAPDDDSTRHVVNAHSQIDPRFRYAVEPAAGLSRARNKGLSVAEGRYIAYTDDDVSVDAGWVHGLVRGFQRRADVACVTGLVCTASIANDSEAYFDARTSSWSTRCFPSLFDLSPSSRRGALYPFSAGVFGTGASFAFDRAKLQALGGFDEALGAGTATRGGEDLDVFVRILHSGGAIAYEPAAVVWHHHRADPASLLRQMFGYGTGLTAFLTKLLWQRSTRTKLLVRVPVGLAKMARIRLHTNRRLHESASAPRGALRREFAGLVAGPALYAKSRRRTRDERSSTRRFDKVA